MLLGMQKVGMSRSTRRCAYAALRGALADAVDNELLATDPVEKVKRPRASTPWGHLPDARAGSFLAPRGGRPALRHGAPAHPRRGAPGQSRPVAHRLRAPTPDATTSNAQSAGIRATDSTDAAKVIAELQVTLHKRSAQMPVDRSSACEEA